MKRITYILFLSIFTFFSCKTGNNITEDKKPFEVEEITFQNHFYGSRDFGRETHLNVKFSSINEGVRPDSIFFRGNSAKLFHNIAEPLVYSASFRVPSDDKGVMHYNTALESKNPVPAIDTKFPFSLANDEAMISYRENISLNHIKIIGLKEIQPLAYPSGGNSFNNQ